MKRTTTLGAVLLGLLVVPAAASADTLYVSPTGTNGAKDKNCSTAAHSSVQSAVNDAKNGGKVYLCGTTPYSENVTIQDKNVDLSGDPGATIQEPSGGGTSVLSILGKTNSHVDGLTIQGPFQDTCSNENHGVLVDGGAKPQLNNVTVQNIHASSSGGCDFYVGVAVFSGSLQIQNSTVRRFADFGVLSDGSDSKLQVQSSTIDGADASGDPSTRVGILIGDGASGEVQKSAINNNETMDPSATVGIGVLVSGGCGGPLTTHIQIHDNALTNNDNAVALDNFAVNSNCDHGETTAPPTKTDNHVNNNVIVKNDGVTNQTAFTDYFGNSYTAYQAGVSVDGNSDDVNGNKLSDNGSGAFGPMTTAGGPFLVPIDIQTEPTLFPKIHDNKLNGSKTTPPY